MTDYTLSVQQPSANTQLAHDQPMECPSDVLFISRSLCISPSHRHVLNSMALSTRWVFHTPVGLGPVKYRGGGGKDREREDVLCNVYFSTTRAATDKRSLPVERLDQVAKGWPLKQRLGPLKSRNIFYENPLVSGYCQFLDNSLKLLFALKNYPFKILNIPTRTHR